MLMRPDGSLRNGLTQLTNRLPDGAIIAEIGSYLGESARIFLDAGARLVICIDPWRDGYDPTDAASARNNLADIEQEFNARMAGHTCWVKLKMRGCEAAGIIADGTLDLAYIDAKHVYADVIADIQAWRPKVRKGGFIGGHDWPMAQVQNAVMAELGTDVEIFDDGSWLKQL